MRYLFFFLTFLFLNGAAKAENILMIGDSISCGTFGPTMVSDLTKDGNQVQLFCCPSSRPTHWILGTNPKGQKCQTMRSEDKMLMDCADNGKVPKIDEILAQSSASKVIVALGTNSLQDGHVDHHYKEMAAKILRGPPSRSCTWMGPPHLHPSSIRSVCNSRWAIWAKPMARLKCQRTLGIIRL